MVLKISQELDAKLRALAPSWVNKPKPGDIYTVKVNQQNYKGLEELAQSFDTDMNTALTMLIGIAAEYAWHGSCEEGRRVIDKVLDTYPKLGTEDPWYVLDVFYQVLPSEEEDTEFQQEKKLKEIRLKEEEKRLIKSKQFCECAHTASKHVNLKKRCMFSTREDEFIEFPCKCKRFKKPKRLPLF